MSNQQGPLIDGRKAALLVVRVRTDYGTLGMLQSPRPEKQSRFERLGRFVANVQEEPHLAVNRVLTCGLLVRFPS